MIRSIENIRFRHDDSHYHENTYAYISSIIITMIVITHLTKIPLQALSEYSIGDTGP